MNGHSDSRQRDRRSRLSDFFLFYLTPRSLTTCITDRDDKSSDRPRGQKKQKTGLGLGLWSCLLQCSVANDCQFQLNRGNFYCKVIYHEKKTKDCNVVNEARSVRGRVRGRGQSGLTINAYIDGRYSKYYDWFKTINAVQMKKSQV